MMYTFLFTQIFCHHEKATNPRQLKKSLSLSGRPKTKGMFTIRYSHRTTDYRTFVFLFPINSLSIYGSMATPHGWHLPELNLSYNPMLTAYKQVVSSG